MGGTFGWAYTYTAKIERTDDEIEFFNVWGKSTSGKVKMSNYSHVGTGGGTCGKHARLTKTDDYVRRLKESSTCCACCIMKSTEFDIKELSEWIKDHGIDKEVA